MGRRLGPRVRHALTGRCRVAPGRSDVADRVRGWFEILSRRLEPARRRFTLLFRRLEPVRGWLERRALWLTALVTTGVLAVMLYLPVGSSSSRPSSSTERRHSITSPTSSPTLLLRVPRGRHRGPLTVGTHLGALAGWLAGVSISVSLEYPVPGVGVPIPWLGLETPGVRMGLFGFTAYQAALSTVASVALGLPRRTSSRTTSFAAVERFAR